MKKILVLICLVFSARIVAEPEFKGTPEELSAYLNSVSKIVAVSATATKKIASNEAIVTLLVKTEDSSLASALASNSKIRANIRHQLGSVGIEPSNIRESKFSSVPEYGFFGEEPKAYTVSNVLSVVVASEAQMISVAKVSDKNKNVRYLSSKAKEGDRSKIKALLLKQALSIADEKVSIYEQELGVKLTPVAFNEASTRLMESAPVLMRARKAQVSSDSAEAPSHASFGEAEFTLTIQVKYKLTSK